MKKILIIFIPLFICKCLAIDTPKNFWVSPYGLVPVNQLYYPEGYDSILVSLRQKTKMDSLLSIPQETNRRILTGNDFTQSENTVCISPLEDDINSAFKASNSNISTNWPVDKVFGVNYNYTTNAGTNWNGSKYAIEGESNELEGGDQMLAIDRIGRIFLCKARKNEEGLKILDVILTFSTNNGNI
ncbi:MAG: Exo-alpha-sialidase, partial [Bacteroidota bacterium]|nr:Exo-alpha-sialidase [Bacteroidota bacterium]